MKRCLRVFSLVMVVFVAFSAFSISALAKSYYEYMDDIVDNVDLSYEDEIKPCFYPEIFAEETEVWYYYNMLYAHYDGNKTVPEYVVFIALTYSWSEEADVSRNIGDCDVYIYNISYPYDLAHYVYVPSLKKVYTLEEAYYSQDLDISAAMRSGRIGLHKGDVNYDRACNILDATYIQMYLVRAESYDYNVQLDIDGSGNVSIIDVTKLQRYLAKLDDSLTVVTSVEP